MGLEWGEVGRPLKRWTQQVKAGFNRLCMAANLGQPALWPVYIF